MEGESKYTQRQLDLLNGKVNPRTTEEVSWLDKHSGDVLSMPKPSPSATAARPPIDFLPPVSPITGERVELLPGRPKKSSYPGENPPRPSPTKGALED